MCAGVLAAENSVSVAVGDSAKVSLSVDAANPISAKNPHAVRVTLQDLGAARAGVANDGYWGMSLTQAEFKDIRVTRGNEVVYTCDFADGTRGWNLDASNIPASD